MKNSRVRIFSPELAHRRADGTTVGITCALLPDMGDLDRRKHDVDIIERVLGGIRDNAETSESYTRVVDVDFPHTGDSEHSTLELTVSLEDTSDRSPSRRRS